jgi:hypothetical protein
MSSIISYNGITDFVIPLHRYHYMVRTVIEAINNFYSPRNIYIITPECYCKIINTNKISWNISNIIEISEETFFTNNYKLHYDDIKRYFTKKENDKNREFGWWYQQIIKLAAFKQIPQLSDPYIVWDSDLIPLTRWEIYPTVKNNYYKFAILQENTRAEWVIEEYEKSLLFLTDLPLCDPEIGTFVPHHHIFYHNILQELINRIESKMNECWIKSIISVSNNYYRFSEYRAISSLMQIYHPDLLNYHLYEEFGKHGQRIRENSEFLHEINNYMEKEKIDIFFGISYVDFTNFCNEKYNKLPTYLQIEHI